MVPGSPADFGKLVVDDKEKWAKVIRAALLDDDAIESDDPIE
jgi:hypothetical protein